MTAAHQQNWSIVVIEEELDPHAIFASVGEVPYEWLIDSDRIVWGRNVGAVLPVADPAALDHGRGYAQLVDPNGGPSRSMPSCARAPPTGAPAFPIRCNMRCGCSKASPLVWIEDTGRWFAGPDRKPRYAHGVVRVINERHEREQGSPCCRASMRSPVR